MTVSETPAGPPDFHAQAMIELDAIGAIGARRAAGVTP